jgi:glycosyltransferase involved in cell wall biosynthesis
VKILHVGKYFPPYCGGMETYLRDLMAGLARRNIDNSALVHQSDISFKSRHERYNASGRELPVTRAAVWARLLFTPVSPTFPWLLKRAIKQQKPDVLHLHLPNVSAFWALLLPGARNIPWLVQWQSDVLASRHSLGLRLFYALYRPFERAVLEKCAVIICSSPPYLNSSEALAEFRDKCTIVPLGLDPANLAYLNDSVESASGRLDNAPLQVLAIGRLTYYKGFEYLIRAAAEVDNIQVHLVGQGDQESALKTLTAELALEHKVFFHGHLPDEELAGQYANCDCVCLPSIERSEAFGLVLLEAMYWGKPTIASDVPGSGMGWIVDHGVTGLKVSPENTEDLASALLYLEQHRDKIAHLGKNGRDKFDGQFHIDRCAESIAQIYQQILTDTQLIAPRQNS